MHFIGMTSRREFLDRSGRLALSLGVLRAGARLGASGGAAWASRGLEASAGLQGRTLTLGNEAIVATWNLADSSLRPSTLTDRIHRVDLPLSSELFTLTLNAGPTASVVPASALRIVGEPRMEPLAANPSASRLAERIQGRSIAVTLRDADGKNRSSMAWHSAGWFRVRATGAHGAGARRRRSAARDLAVRLHGATNVGERDGARHADRRRRRVLRVRASAREQRRGRRSRPVSDGEDASAASGNDARRQLGRRRDAQRPAATRFSRVRRAGARASVPHVPALQLVVRHRLLLEVQRSRRARRGERVRDGAAREARRHARLVPVRRRLGRPHDALAIQLRLSERLRRGARRDRASTARRPACGCRRGAATASRTTTASRSASSRASRRTTAGSRSRARCTISVFATRAST